MLAPMPIACNLGLTPLAAPTIVPMALGLGGNASPSRTPSGQAMREHGAAADLDPAATGAALQSGRRRSRRGSARPLRFAVVHPHSGHNYELRYWLAACGIDPDRDIEIVILPPPLMADALGAGAHRRLLRRRALEHGRGRAGHRPYRHRQSGDLESSPDKVLGVRAAWADDQSRRAGGAAARALPRRRMVRRPGQPWRAGAHACRAGLSRPPAEWMLPALDRRSRHGRRRHRSRSRTSSCPTPRRRPSRGRAMRCGSIRRWCAGVRSQHTRPTRAIARDTYRPDLYRAALKPLGVALPGANAKVEGALRRATPVGSAGASLTLGPDGFFDGGCSIRTSRRLHRRADGSRRLIMRCAHVCTAQYFAPLALTIDCSFDRLAEFAHIALLHTR